MKKQGEEIRGNKGLDAGGAGAMKGSNAPDREARMAKENRAVTEGVSRTVQKSPKKQANADPKAWQRVMGQAGQFFREAKVELKKVKWPTRKELLASTAVVIVLTILVSFYLGLVDFALIKIIRNVAG